MGLGKAYQWEMVKVVQVQGSLMFGRLVSDLNCLLLSEMWHVDKAQHGFTALNVGNDLLAWFFM